VSFGVLIGMNGAALQHCCVGVAAVHASMVAPIRSMSPFEHHQELGRLIDAGEQPKHPASIPIKKSNAS
jgi:hypothetical protein